MHLLKNKKKKNSHTPKTPSKTHRLMVYSTEHQQSMEHRLLKPLHNFDLPCLKWGNQKLLRCIKVHPDDDVASVKKRFRSSSPSSSENKKMKSLMIGDEDEIEATREKLMLDFHKEVGKIKDAILKQRFVDRITSSPANVTSSSPSPWNLRTRRAACKAPRSPVNGVNNEVNVLKNMSSPVRFNGNGNGERAKFSVALSRREVEDDFMTLTGRRLPRKPKKRPRAVQKQLDTLFPGLWLTEITPDLYKVPDEIETGKR